MAWPRVGQGGRSETSAIQTAPQWMKPTKMVDEQNNKQGTYKIKMNDYDALMEHYEDATDDEPTLVTISGEQTATPAESNKTAKMASGKTTFAQYVRYKKWFAWKQKNESNSHVAADGLIYKSKKIPGVAAITTTETPAMPATKQSTMETNRMTTSPAQGMRRKAIPAKRQDVVIGGRRVHDCTLFEECVGNCFILFS